MASGLPPRKMRRQRNSADAIRRPASGAIERTTVSTSGSSGTALGNHQEDVFAILPDFIGGHPLSGIVIVFAGAAVKLPQVIRANHAAIVKLALAQRAATMDAHAAERAQPASHIAN